MYRYALRDDQWERIKDFLPGRKDHVGGTAADNRLFVDAVIYRYRTGIPWRDLPERYGQWKPTHRRYRRWCKSGVFARIFETLASDADNEFMMIDATIIMNSLSASDANVSKMRANTPLLHHRRYRLCVGFHWP